MGERLIRPVTSTELVGKNNGRSFRTTDEIGRGSHARVYSGTDLQTGAPVAVKLFDATIDPKAIEREAAAQADLNHPNIAAFIDFDYATFGRTPFLVVELINGDSLRNVIPPEGLDVEEAVPPLLDATRALSYMHRKKRRAHGDIKPGNIVVDNENIGKLIDFGLTTSIDTRDNVSDEFTPAFASPEQVLGQGGTAEGDVYGLASTAINALTGQNPFGDLPLEEYIIAKLHGNPISVSEVRGWSVQNVAIDIVLSQGMDRIPQRRPSIEVFARGLQAAALLKGREVVVIDMKSSQLRDDGMTRTWQSSLEKTLPVMS